jgi:hypothetical protein
MLGFIRFSLTSALFIFPSYLLSTAVYSWYHYKPDSLGVAWSRYQKLVFDLAPGFVISLLVLAGLFGLFIYKQRRGCRRFVSILVLGLFIGAGTCIFYFADQGAFSGLDQQTWKQGREIIEYVAWESAKIVLMVSPFLLISSFWVSRLPSGS